MIVANRSEGSLFAGGLVLNTTPDSPRFSKDFDFFHDAVEALATASERDAAALRAAGFEVIPNIDYGSWDMLTIEMKMEWIEMCDKAEAEMIHLADTQPDMPIGVVFVTAKGEPGWIGTDPTLRIHRLSLRGSWPETIQVGAGI